MTESNGFSQNAHLYADSAAHSQTHDLELALESLGDPDGWEILDVATGTGHTAFFFSQRQAHVFGVDINDEMLAIAQEEADRKSLSCRFLKGSCDDLPFDDATFDLVTCRLAAHHFAEPTAFLKEAHRVLRPAGRMLLVDNIVPTGSVGKWINDFEYQRDPSHRACLTEESWKELFRAQNFKEVKLQEFPRELDFDLWMDRMSVESHDRDRAWEKLCQAPGEVVEYLQPRQDGEIRFLTLHRLLALVGTG